MNVQLHILPLAETGEFVTVEGAESETDGEGEEEGGGEG